MLELWLIRHAQTLWNAEGRIQGQSDAPLSARGVSQAQQLARRLAPLSFDTLCSSDTGRAVRTAEIAFGGRAFTLEPRLRELNYGTLEGKTRDELQGAELEAFQEYWHDPYDPPTPGGESWLELDVRVFAWLGALPREGRIAAITHGGTLRSALFYVTGAPKKREWNVFFGHTSVTRLRLGSGSANAKVLVALNERCHLASSSVDDSSGDSLDGGLNNDLDNDGDT